MGTLQVVAEGRGPCQGRSLVGTGEQLLHEVTAQAELRIRQALQPGQLHGEHGGAVLEGHPLAVPRLPARIEEDHDSYDVLPCTGDKVDPGSLPDRAVRRHHPSQQCRAGRRVILEIRRRLAGACPGPQVAVPVLDGDRVAGELVHGLGDSRLAQPGRCHLGQPLVDGGAVFQGGNRFAQCAVRRAEALGACPLTGKQRRVRQRHPELLREHAEQEPFGRGRLAAGRHHHVAERTGRASQGFRPPPFRPGDVQESTDRHAAHLRLHLVPDNRVGARSRGGAPPCIEEPDPFQAAPAQGRQRVRDHLHDPVAVRALGHQPGEQDHALQAGELVAKVVFRLAWRYLGQSSPRFGW